MSEKIALVVEGGAMRGIFAAGILDSFLKNKFNPFDICIGVSAGANNLTAYLAEMYEMTYPIYTDYMLRKDFFNLNRFIRGGHFIDLDWLWDITKQEVFNKEISIREDKQFYIVLTKVSTGEPMYIKPDSTNLYDILKAGCAMPFVYRKFPKYNEEEMTDGGVADPIPVKQAVKFGANKVVVIRSKKKDACLSERVESLVCKLFLRKHKNLAKKMAMYHKNYNTAVKYIKNPPKGVEVITIEPPDNCCVSSFTTIKEKLENDYNIARNVGNQFIKNWS